MILPRRVVLPVAVGMVGMIALTGCDRLRHDVTLAHVWDTEAPTILTSQRDATADVCGVSSACVEALSADQGMFLKFSDERGAEVETGSGDVVVRGIFIMRWTAPVSEQDREYVQYMLETAGNSH